MAGSSITSLHHNQYYANSISHLYPKTPYSYHKTPLLISLSFSPHRRRRRRNSLRNPNKNDSNSSNSSAHDYSSKLQFILDVDQLKSKTPISVIEGKIREFVDDGIEAYEDLRGLIRVEGGSNRVIVSCSEKSVRFVGGVLVWSCVVVVVIRVLVKLGLGFGGGWRGGFGKEEVVTRMDRSLGGKEVVVAKRGVVEGGGKRVGDVGRNVERDWEMAVSRNKERGERMKRLPGWWPVYVPRPVLEAGREEYQREAKLLTRAIMDDKLRGKDVSEEDIIELRRICKKSGIQLSFETDNARDSLYRLSVQNVISTCCRAGNPSVQIDGEDIPLFIAGLAYDVGLANFRAATIVSATVAAQTRQWFLQAWALEMQAKHLEAMEELRKICLIHHIFPPEPSSPEMEMVARGLQKHLSIDQREFLLTTLIGVCGHESRRSAAEALGLV
ncbi:uncharacterized protein LOC141619023 [Silene latifolia]|uniref:uncharacterized protein LOC141619023 n=1 Tax=Silene latifolia TaxID=37657 RepID=UPI003D77B81D